MQNPSDKHCWSMCSSCYRCSQKGCMSACASCSGRHDPNDRRYPDPDDYCRCAEGILQYKTQNGKLIVKKFYQNPFGGTVKTESASQDETDWQAYLKASREKLDDPNWDPITFYDGTSVDKWFKAHDEGRA